MGELLRAGAHRTAWRTSTPGGIGIATSLVPTGQAGFAARAGDHAIQDGRPASTLEQHRRAQLTARELEVLELLVRGLPNKQICRELNIAGGTVKTHVTRILEKLRVDTRLQAVIVALRRNLLPSPAGAREHRRAVAG